jgi:hypothetical protein
MATSQESQLLRIIRLCFSGGIPRRSLIVAIIVGTILNLINQSDGLFGRIPIDWTRLILTYMVPYCVSTYGAVSALVARGGPGEATD